MSPNKGDSIRFRISQVVSHTRSQFILTCLRVPTSVPVIAVVMTSRLVTACLGAVLIQKPSTCERSFASGFDVDANSEMGKSHIDGRVSVATTYLRCLAHVTQAAWQAVIDMWQEASYRIAQTECTHTPELRVCRAN